MQREIAEKFDCEVGTVRRVQKRAGLMMRKPWRPLGKENIKQIIAMTRRGDSQRQIAEALKIHPNSVYLCQRRLGVHACRPQGLARLSGVQLLKISNDILDRRASALAISKQYSVSHKLVLKLAHRLLRCPRFLPAGKLPLSSDFPSAFRSPLAGQAVTESDVIQMIEIIRGYVQNEFPKDPAERVKLCTEICLGLIPDEIRLALTADGCDKVRACIGTHFQQAFADLRLAQETAGNGMVN